MKTLKLETKTIIGTHDTYAETTVNPVSKSQYRKINEEFNKFMINKCLQGYKINLPCFLGTLQVNGKKMKPYVSEDGKIRGLSIDWVKTIELWNNNPEAKKKKTKIYFTNPHTDGVSFKWFWSKLSPVETKRIDFFTFSATRTNKRAVARTIKEGNHKFVINR